MGLFSFKYSERESELEKVLQGVVFSGELKFNYTERKKDEKGTSPIYLLPVDAHNNIIYGYFTADGKPAEVPIGFSRRKNFIFKEYFRPNLAGNLAKENEKIEEAIYLPLSLTDLVLGVGEEKEGKWTACEGSPFPIFGIEGQQGIHPLILVSETEERLICEGFYKTKDGELSVYIHQKGRPSDKEVREVLKTLKRFNFVQERRIMQETAQIGATKAREPAKQLETISNVQINWEEPKSIVDYLDQYVVGQKDAKKIIAVAFSNYMTKLRTQNEELDKDNILLIGPSGVGKTYMISLLAKTASLPMVQTKLTGKSSEGYKGENLSTVFEQMRAMANCEAPYGIIFFDEIDKLARDEWGGGHGFGTRLQDELIGWLEEATILGDRDNNKVNNGLNTKNILFVTAGTFQGPNDSSLEGIIRKRLGVGQNQIGFETTEEQNEKNSDCILGKVRPEDLILYGLKPELVGRLPSVGVLNKLTIEDKVRILTAMKRSPITNYSELLQLKGYKVVLDENVPEIIALHCPEETGARALSAICNDMFTEILFDPAEYADKNKIIRVTADLAKKLINLYA